MHLAANILKSGCCKPDRTFLNMENLERLHIKHDARFSDISLVWHPRDLGQ